MSMAIPAVKGYMALCVTLRSQVCDEQGIGQWPMWKRFDSIKAIVDQYIEEPYRNFLARPELDVDKQKSEEYFYWYTPRTNVVFSRLNCSGDDHDYYKKLLDETLEKYHSTIKSLKADNKDEEANFLELSLKYAGESEENVFCGDGRVVATVWGMRPRPGIVLQDSIIEKELFPPAELFTIRFDLGGHGSTVYPTTIRKSLGTKIYAHQVPLVKAFEGFEFVGWDRDPIGKKVNSDLLFTAQYKELSKEPQGNKDPIIDTPDTPLGLHHVRFLSPDGQVIKELDVIHGKQILPGFVPQLPVINGIQCTSWDGDPLNDTIISDRDYRAICPAIGNNEKKTGGCLFGDNGCLSALLNWLLLGVGLLLLAILLWCFLGKCNFNLCGCDCDGQGQLRPLPGPNPPIQNPCNTQQASGGEEGYMGYFDMGEQSGKFKFEYDTQRQPDRIIIYDGKGTSGQRIFSFEGGTSGWVIDEIDFHKRIVTVTIEGLEPGTIWSFNIYCPNK